MIHYTKFLCKNKDADWITFVHGAGGSSTIWFKQIKYFSKNTINSRSHSFHC